MGFRLLENEGGVNQAIATTLFEDPRWKRSDVDKKILCSIFWPITSACGAVHVDDVQHIFLDEDLMGNRVRAKSFFQDASAQLAADAVPWRGSTSGVIQDATGHLTRLLVRKVTLSCVIRKLLVLHVQVSNAAFRSSPKLGKRMTSET